MKQCFVMQPFDGGKFDKRFREIIEPVLVDCGYSPYRVDMDDTADVLIEAIEKGIAKSEFCLAEITTPNPNVWYELGFAFALGKRVIMLSSDEREGVFPFDVRHRNILTYKTESPSDFDDLKNNLKRRITGSIQGNTTPLTELERFLISFVYNNLNTPNEVFPKERIRVEEGDVPAALKRLVTNGYLEYIYAVSESEHQNSYYRVTDKALPLLKA